MELKIKDINQFSINFQLKAKIVFKSQLSTYNNQRGDGRYFFIHAEDETGKIKITFFQELADQAFSKLEIGKLYAFHNMSAKAVNTKYSNINDVEIIANSNARIQEIKEEKMTFEMKFINNFNEFLNRELNSSVNLEGYIIEIFPMKEVACSNGTKAKLREIKIGNNFGQGIKVTMWGHHAEKQLELNQKIKIINGILSEWIGNKYINCNYTTITEIFQN